LRKRTKLAKWSGPVSISVVLVLLLLCVPFPSDVRGLIALLLILAWTFTGLIWLVQRFGLPAILGIIALVVPIAGAVSYSYWQDAPNREAYARIKELGASFVGTRGKVFTGEVDYVYFDSDANDAKVRQFTELEGIDDLDRLVIQGSGITDATARKVTRFKKMKYLYLGGTRVSREVVAELRAALPDCRIQVE
jgi:hypothetical protein